MSTVTDRSTRPYRQKKRARQQEETRLRIVETLVEMHRTVGPAGTTVTELAERAGVGRMTVYNHFPTEADLIDACSAHWIAQHPTPDPQLWAAIEEPEERLQAAITAIYRYYRDNQDMLGKVLRDEPLVPALAETMGERWWPFMEAVIAGLRDSRLRGARRKQATAILRLALGFGTWRTLTGSGLGDDQAAELATRLVRGADPSVIGE